jgi:hypothetical protein
MNKGVLKDSDAPNFHGLRFCVYFGIDILIAELNEVGKCRWIGVPVPTTLVFEDSNVLGT